MMFWRGSNRGAANSTAADHRFPDDRSASAVAGRVLSPDDHAREALALLRNHEDSGHGWFWATDADGRITYLSDSVARQLSDAPEALVGTSFADLFRPVDDVSDARRTLPFVLAKRSRFERLTLASVRDGDERRWSVSGSPQLDAAGMFIGYRGSGTDITEQHRTTQQASQLAMYDTLTGLPNRLRMADVLRSTLAATTAQRRPCAVMLIDLDRFKQVNDTLGHPAGDLLLKQVSGRLLRIIGDKEKIFRLGGDEFEVILRDIGDRDQLAKIADDIINGLSQPYSVDGSRCIIGASVGIAVAPDNGTTAQELIRNADLALYAAKGGGRGRCYFFSNDLLKEAEDRRVLEVDLRDALARDQIKLFYQPIVDTRTNHVTGVEALVRWQHPNYGWVSPALFIPIAEETGLVAQLGEWILRKACADAANWPGKIRVAVNVSPIQFANEALPKIVMSALASSGLAASRLELEITEGVFLSDSIATDRMFAALKDIGVRLALDDFGTGYSSLGYLRTAPFDKIKIDQSFVREATLAGSRNAAIIAAIVALAEALGMETTAEGIETLDQLELMSSLRVSHAQGYVYSRAVPADALAERLQSGDWVIVPTGPARQRSVRHSMYRRVGAIFANRYQSVLLRNLSETGALIEASADLVLDTHFILDFGEGQLVSTHVRRVERQQYGVEFDEPLVSDGVGGFSTRNRVSAYQLSGAGLPTGAYPAEAQLWDRGASQTVESLAAKFGLAVAPDGIGAPPGPIPLIIGTSSARRLTPDEVERLQRAVDESHNPQLKHFVALLIATGARQRELLEAEWSHVDLDRGIWEIPTPRCDKPRAVPLSTAAIAAFRAVPRLDGCRHVITNPKTGKPYRSFAASWESARSRAGLPFAEIEELRHSMVSAQASTAKAEQTARVVKRFMARKTG
jgi:diguanylate cyclase (GGDEF)-like protein/PAS domain S-box-containing protein